MALPPSSPQGALGATLERSKQLCLQMYEKELFSETSYESATAQLVCTSEQLAVFAGKLNCANCDLDQFCIRKDCNVGVGREHTAPQVECMSIWLSATVHMGLCF